MTFIKPDTYYVPPMKRTPDLTGPDPNALPSHKQILSVDALREQAAAYEAMQNEIPSLSASAKVRFARAALAMRFTAAMINTYDSDYIEATLKDAA